MVSLLPTLGMLVIASGGLTLVLGKEAATSMRQKANSLAWLVMGTGAALFISGSLLQWGI